MQVAKQMFDEVFAMEPPETRNLEQVITPPMSEAAREARSAITSIDL